MMNSDTQVHILLVEDDPDQVAFLKLTLRIELNSPYSLTHAASLAEAKGIIGDGLQPDIVLLDLHLPDSEGIDTPREMLALVPDIPIIIYSGNTDVEVAIEAVRLGAQDYLLKGEAREPLLSRSIRYAIERKRNARELAHALHLLEDRNAALEIARSELRSERDMFVSGPTVLFRREFTPGFPITFVSRNVSQFGFLQRDLMVEGFRYDSIVFTDDRESFRNLLTSRLAEGVESVEQEYRILDASGEIVWLHEVARIQRDNEGVPVAQLAYVVDITRRRQAEKNLQTTRRRFDSILGTISEIVYELDIDGRLLYISPAIERILGWEADGLIGQPFSELVIEAQRSGWEETLPRIVSGTVISCEFPLSATDGRERVFQISARRQIDGGQVRAIAGVLSDITERKEMEHAIRNVRTQAQQFLDIAEVVFLSIDLSGRVSLVNKKGCQVLGFSEHELVGRDWFDTCIPAQIRDDVRSFFFRIVEGVETQPEVHENLVQTKSGDSRLIRWHNSLLHDARGAVIGLLSSGDDVTDRRKIEQEAKGSQELIELALWGADLGAWEWDIHSDAITLNFRALSMLGYEAEQLPSFSKLREETLPGEDAERLDTAMKDHLEGRSPFYQAETWLICKSGEWKWVLERGKVVEYDASGAPLRVAGTYLDLTIRKYAEIALEDSEKKFRLLAENSSDIIWTVNAEFELTFVSPSVEFVLGYSAEEIMRQDFFDVLEENFRKANRGAFVEFMQTAHLRPSQDRTLREEVPFLRKDGSVLWVEVVATPILDRAGNLVSIHGNSRDIHHRRIAQLGLAESEEKYRLLVQNQTDLVIKVDLDGRFQFVSPSYCRMFGKTEDELLQQTFFPMVHEDDRLTTLEAMKTLFEPPYTSYMEQRALTRDGWRWLGWQDTAVLNEKGEVVEIIGVGRDVTERRMAERALIESEKRLRTVISNLPVVMFTLTRDGIFTLSEGMGLESLSLHPGQVVGLSAFDVYADYPEVTTNIRRALEGEAFVAAVEVDEKSFETWYSPVFGDGGEVEHVIGVSVDITNRMKTEQELNQYRNHLEELVEARTLELERANESLKRFRFALDSAADNIYIIDPETMKYVDLNEGAVEALEYEREELLTMGPADVQVHPDKSAHLAIYAQVRAGELEVGIFETEHRKKDGSTFPAEVFVRAFESGESRLLIATARDVSRRRAVELALKESEAKYRNVLENANEAIIVLQDNLLRFYNYKVLELTGLSEAALKDLPIFEFVHPDDHALLRRQYQERMHGGLLPESYDVRMFDSNGTIKWMEVRDVLITWDGKPATLNFFNDITARKHAEEYIRFQASLLSIVHNSVIALDYSGRVTYWNSFAETLFGWSAQEVHGRKLHEFPTFGAEFETEMLPAIRERGHWEGEVELPRSDGTLLSVYSMWNVITQDDQLRGYVGIGMDLSERKKLERELLQSQKLASLGILSEGIAHELRNPLGYASSAAQLLISKKDLTEEQRKKYSTVIHTGVDRANKIVENLLLIGKPKGQLMKKRLNLIDTVKEAISLISSHHNADGIQTELQFASTELHVLGNREMLVQLFYNLFTNALDAMAGSGSLRVSGEQKGAHIRIRVSDTGPGVPEHIVENIFDPFFTTSKTDKGVGLGLTLCYFIMDDHEGRIELDTAAETGATFILIFPAV
ncbi:MAG: PAS domain S-box protein [Bacteroidota bacterium]|jgi:PAS domain S-box-containing protein